MRRLNDCKSLSQSRRHGSQLVSDLLRRHALQLRAQWSILSSTVIQIWPKTQCSSCVIKANLCKNRKKGRKKILFFTSSSTLTTSSFSSHAIDMNPDITSHKVFLQHSPVSHNAWLHPRYNAPAGKHPQKEPGYTDEQTQCFDKSGPPVCEQKH